MNPGATAAPPHLSAKQARSIAHATARINIWSGAVRSGKTVSSLLRWLVFVAQAPRTGHLVVSGKTLDTIARNVFGPLTDPTVVGPDIAAKVRYTRGASTASILGRQVEVIPANDARAEGRLRGLTASGVYLDEVTLVSREFFGQALARLSVPGAMLFGTTNPGSRRHWLRTDYYAPMIAGGEDAPDLRWFDFTLDDNPGLRREFIEATKREHTGVWYQRFVLGLWRSAEGAVYDMWDDDVHIVSTLPPIMAWLVVGVDYGTVNPFHALLVGISTDGRLVVADEWRYDGRSRQRAMTDAQYSQALREWLATTPAAGGQPVAPRWVVVDPSAASMLAQLGADGWQSLVKADNAVADGIRDVATLLGWRRLIVHERCEYLIGEMTGYEWDPAAQARGVDAPLKVDDHGADALRYAVRTTRSVWRQYISEPFSEQRAA